MDIEGLFTATQNVGIKLKVSSKIPPVFASYLKCYSKRVATCSM